MAAAALVAAAIGFSPLFPAAAHFEPPDGPPYLDGGDEQCPDWKLRFLDLGFASYDVAEEGWVWVDEARKFQSASGVATKSKIAHNDTPANHYSHDWNVDIRVDEGQEYLLSDINGREFGADPDVPQKIELEWETGITPDQTSGSDDDPWFPAWVTPNIGDRVWTNGHWVFDCGHAEGVSTPAPVEGDPESCPPGTGMNPITFRTCDDKHFRSEIHPGRAIASMRSQTATLPGSGTTPVPVTATDLYMHGRGGFMVQQLACGIGIILDDEDPACQAANTTTPIDDTYTFDICLPPKPDHPGATLDWSVQDGPGNTLGHIPDIKRVDLVDGPCSAAPDEFGNDFEDNIILRVGVALNGASPTDVYARRIVAGWVFPTDQPLRHLQLKLDKMDLHNDHEAPGFNGEMSFLWMNVDRAPQDEWHRLVHWDIPTDDNSGAGCGDHTNTLQSYDDDDLCGTGPLNFFGPTFDFYPRPGQDFTVRTTGFEQDCYDGNFGDGDFTIREYIGCHGGDPTEVFNWGNNDKLADVAQAYPSDVATGRYEPSGLNEITFLDEEYLARQFELEFNISEIPLTDEDTANLGVTKTCTQPGEVPLAGQPFTCTVTMTNHGPGLPRDVVLADTLTTALPSAQYALGTPAATVDAAMAGEAAVAVPCAVTPPNAFSCDIGTIPVGRTATVTVPVTPNAPGTFDNVAAVSTASTDPVASNNSAQDTVEVYLPVTVDVQPGDAINAINTGKHGLVSVAVVTTSTFDAASIDVSSVCFGDPDEPSQRDCTESHGLGHLTDVDRDRDRDLLLHYEFPMTGIDPGDTRACLIGRTSGGIGVYGCDFVRAL